MLIISISSTHDPLSVPAKVMMVKGIRFPNDPTIPNLCINSEIIIGSKMTGGPQISLVK